MNESPQTFEAVKSRIDEIVDEVSREGVSLDDALTLYEEAIKLGLSACELSESDIFPPRPEPETAEIQEEAAYAVPSGESVEYGTAVLAEEGADPSDRFPVASSEDQGDDPSHS